MLDLYLLWGTISPAGFIKPHVHLYIPMCIYISCEGYVIIPSWIYKSPAEFLYPHVHLCTPMCIYISPCAFIYPSCAGFIYPVRDMLYIPYWIFISPCTFVTITTLAVLRPTAPHTLLAEFQLCITAIQSIMPRDAWLQGGWGVKNWLVTCRLVNMKWWLRTHGCSYIEWCCVNC